MMTRITPILCLLTLPMFLCTAGQASPAAASAFSPVVQPSRTADESESLQQFLERMRQEREVAFESSRKMVQELMKRLESNPKSPAGAAEVRAELVDLGPELAPLLVPYLDPGTTSGRGELHRASQVIRVLLTLSTDIVTSDLLQQARRGTPAGRKNAIEALAGAPEAARERVVRDLNELYTNAETEVRSAVLTTLAQLGGSQVNDIFVSALSETDDNLVAAALDALTNAANENVAKHVLELSQSSRSGPHIFKILDYYLAVPKIVKDEHVLALLISAERESLSSNNQRNLLDMLRRLDFSVDRSIEGAMTPFLKANQQDVIDSARTLLASKGDRGMRRELLDERNAIIGKNKDWARGYSQRGDVYFKLADYRLALKDYRLSIKLSGNAVDVNVQIAIARCYAIQGKHKDAANELNRSSVSIRKLKDLGSDPDFLEMAQDSKYRSGVFRLQPLEDE
ncbi:MAG: hypothetical protein ACI835_002526 [Planctomycetota bacterium]|jgi:hypothetical protein